MSKPIFLYGTLRYEPLLRLVAGEELHLRRARLPGFACHWARGGSWPQIVQSPKGVAEGVVCDALSDAALERMDFYEAGFGYELADVTLDSDDGPISARVYMPPEGQEIGAPWDLDAWAETWGAVTLEAAQEVMSYLGQVSSHEVAARFPVIRARAASRLRARSGSGQNVPDIGTAMRAQDVEIASHTRPYSNFFAVEEAEIRYKRFDGTQNAQILRASFAMCDAVTVLPYDPASDRVLLVEQMRFGALMRGDNAPWMVEAIAGRIDPGETPQEAVHREAEEEAGLAFRELVPIAEYYPSPGAITEYLYCFVGICDLAQVVQGHGGLESEHEDIRSHVVSFDALMAMVDAGQMANGPLLLSALWLARQREVQRRSA